jgi:hypothetical protein
MTDFPRRRFRRAHPPRILAWGNSAPPRPAQPQTAFAQ